MKKPVTYLRVSKYRRKYNSEVRKALKNADITFEEKSKAQGKEIWVDADDEYRSVEIILAVPLY